jgi:large subunit ribosomal protein L3
MADGILAKKVGMTQVFSEDGTQIPVTVVEAGPCVVIGEKTVEKDGYAAVQLGYREVNSKRLNRPQRGYLEKRKAPYVKIIREIKPDDPDKYKVGERIVAENIFNAGDIIDVTGVSKGKGFAGVMKRWNFKGGPATHGSMFHRAPGSIGQAADTSKVFKGIKMAGRMGGKRVTVRNLEVVDVLKEKNTMLIKGAVPGSNGGLLLIKKVASTAAATG